MISRRFSWYKFQIENESIFQWFRIILKVEVLWRQARFLIILLVSLGWKLGRVRERVVPRRKKQQEYYKRNLYPVPLANLMITLDNQGPSSDLVPEQDMGTDDLIFQVAVNYFQV